jgi:uncharacterized membrane protein
MNDITFLEALWITGQVAWKVLVPVVPFVGLGILAMFLADYLDYRLSR